MFLLVVVITLVLFNNTWFKCALKCFLSWLSVFRQTECVLRRTITNSRWRFYPGLWVKSFTRRNRQVRISTDPLPCTASGFMGILKWWTGKSEIKSSPSFSAKSVAWVKQQKKKENQRRKIHVNSPRRTFLATNFQSSTWHTIINFIFTGFIFSRATDFAVKEGLLLVF